MKRSFLIIVALLFTTSAFSQNVIQLFNGANDFFRLLQEEKFADAHAIFDDTLKTKLTEEGLKKLWSDMGTKFGKAESFDAIQSRAQGEFFAVTVEGKFSNGDQNFILGFNKAQKIVGIFLAPAKTAAAYVKPAMPIPAYIVKNQFTSVRQADNWRPLSPRQRMPRAFQSWFLFTVLDQAIWMKALVPINLSKTLLAD